MNKINTYLIPFEPKELNFNNSQLKNQIFILDEKKEGVNIWNIIRTDLLENPEIKKEYNKLELENKKLIFISSPLAPYGKYTMEDNIERTKKYTRELLLKHQNCIAPHLYYPNILNDFNFYERQLGLKFSLQLLELCQEMNCYILNGYISKGMYKELELADKLDIKVNKIFIKK